MIIGISRDFFLKKGGNVHESFIGRFDKVHLFGQLNKRGVFTVVLARSACRVVYWVSMVWL